MKTNIWEEVLISGTISNRSMHGSFIYNNFLFICGGKKIRQNSSIRSTDEIWSFNLLSENPSWIFAGYLNRNLRNIKTAIIGNFAYVFFGVKSNGNDYRRISKFVVNINGTIGSFTVLPRGSSSGGGIRVEPNSRKSYSLSVLNSDIYFFGGLDDQNNSADEFGIFNTNTESWVMFRPFMGSYFRINSSLFVIDNNIYLFAGSNNTNFFNDIWLLTDLKKIIVQGSPQRRIVRANIFSYGGFEIKCFILNSFVYVSFYTEIPKNKLKFISLRIKEKLIV